MWCEWSVRKRTMYKGGLFMVWAKNKISYKDYHVYSKQEKIDCLGSECRSLSQKLVRTQEEAQGDIESRIQASWLITAGTVTSED